MRDSDSPAILALLAAVIALFSPVDWGTVADRAATPAGFALGVAVALCCCALVSLVAPVKRAVPGRRLRGPWPASALGG